MEATIGNNPLGWVKELSSQSITKQLMFLVGLAGSIALGVSVILWSQTDDYAPLYANLSQQDSLEIVNSLDASGVKYQLDRVSGTVLVPESEIHKVRLMLASEGLPGSDGKGFDILYKEQELGLSSFMERARYDRALEEELSDTITTLESVRAARVHLAIPKPSGFIRSSGRPAASVMLNLYAGGTLNKRQLDGVKNLVASSVPELSVDDVSVVDQSGRLLSHDDPNDGVFNGLEQLSITEKLEQSYVDRIMELVTPITGVNGIKTQVKAELDFTVTETTSEVYSPDAAVRSEQLSEQSSTDRLNGGIPGTLANQPPPEAELADEPLGDSPAAPVNTSSSAVRNYELDKTISHIRRAPGQLNRLTVAVALDYREVVNIVPEGEENAGEEIITRVPIPVEEVELIRSLVLEAIGYDEARGDRVTVTTTPFMPLPEQEALPSPSLVDTILNSPLIWKIARILIAALVCFILIFKVIKPIMKSVSDAAAVTAAAALEEARPDEDLPPPQPLPAPADAVAEAAENGEDDATLSLPDRAAAQSETLSLSSQLPQTVPGAGPVYQQQLDAARDMISNEPDRVAHVVKNWIASDE